MSLERLAERLLTWN